MEYIPVVTYAKKKKHKKTKTKHKKTKNKTNKKTKKSKIVKNSKATL